MSNAYLPQLKQWSQEGIIRSVDYQLAAFVAEKKPDDSALPLLAALVSFELASGNVCLPLDRLISPKGYWSDEIVALVEPVDWKALKPDARLLMVGTNGSLESALLVLDQGRFYLHRYWQYEIQVAKQLSKRTVPVDVDLPLLGDHLAQLFPKQNEEVDWQKVATAVAIQKRFSVISGGPGTGKTTTVIKLLVLYIQQMQAKGVDINIRLAAPTGKAAARLAESINSAKQKLALPAELAALVPSEASTLHRLLGVIPNQIGFRHHGDNPLHLDLLVLDEASMVDLPMMARLLDALPEHARLILLGDRDQLASVEAGNVLGDICSWPGELDYSTNQQQVLTQLGAFPQAQSSGSVQSFSDCLALLRKSYRFDDKSGIGYMAKAVNSGTVEHVKRVMAKGFEDINNHYLTRDSYEEMINQVVSFYSELFSHVNPEASPKYLLDRLGEFQLLCARREGVYGVAGLNERIQQELRSRGYIKGSDTWFAGRPIMITRNDPALKLFNGDIGIVLADDSGKLKVWFELDGELRSVLPSRLPEHQTVFAMTVHKSQGSEFDTVAFILPPDDSPLLTRELLYTGITRARKTLHLYATKAALFASTQRKTERSGGLAVRLWGGR
ncbi:exodeoxyribonuclease V subunit alpha [Neptuniibacter sp. QD29_5]|uniref:exodeoxyribonuclease V subunit alpha n=1 Tax=Neptuniibacter sp. QD29_5 TaxID=3398207 RepID=UPI0039F56B89